MLHRRPAAIAAPVLGLVLAASMSACGFHYPTDRVNTISAGVNNRTDSVNALGIRILATSEGQGRIIGALSNERDSEATLTKVADADGNVTVAPFTPVKLDGHGAYNFATEVDNPIELTGDFQPGQVLMNLQFTFSRDGSDSTISMNVPIVKNCHEYTAVPTPSSPASASGSTSTSGSASTSESPSAGSSESAGSSDSTESGSAVFDCTDPSPSEAPAE